MTMLNKDQCQTRNIFLDSTLSSIELIVQL